MQQPGRLERREDDPVHGQSGRLEYRNDRVGRNVVRTRQIGRQFGHSMCGIELVADGQSELA
ncbi:hypothetical protein NK983_32395, partial [Salmonella enterica subsp. enterica serovar Typhimurium]|nr:hypothetical protein [Salmonella enterica subsp. enterica serovar Typhimurium]